MEQITREKLKKIVKTLMFDPTEEVVDNILKNWLKLEKEIKWFDNLDLTNIEPMSKIDEEYYIDFLREDDFNNLDSINKSELINNAPQKNNDYVILTKVVK
ncbi:glutamyl-tRNA amidotransferase [Mycoplasmopsis felis]|uniref:glutamyl-tRNA amidotransferase n=1 Tax=Mycoplasmopsis felis TaxID=33923 RepID=UPI002AFE8403|nr:glutamyl-tRNA amidotransferase [Mycoplasmopsis felis]WQQ06117.1 glutamyl-tRNA amidotransferase [Mycoplasmopsis felis]WQQ11393.1 glutamyl-tRNA amidotransferase [Mycoplasmopsis felis]